MEKVNNYLTEGPCLTELFGWRHVKEGQFRALIYAYSGREPLIIAPNNNSQGEADYSHVFDNFLTSNFSCSELERIISFVQNLRLTPAQLALFVLCARSVTPKGICAMLGIAKQTYKNHMSNIFEKVEEFYNRRTDRLGVTVLALEAGVLPVRCLLSEGKLKEIGNLVDHLSEREKEVLKLALIGKGNKEIAYQLRISPQTVKNHMTSIYRTLRIDTGTQYQREAGRENLVPTAFLLNLI